VIRIFVVRRSRRADFEPANPLIENVEVRLPASLESKLRPVLADHCCACSDEEIGNRGCFLFLWADTRQCWTTQLMCPRCAQRTRMGLLQGEL
jgi:hypothetical protein